MYATLTRPPSTSHTYTVHLVSDPLEFALLREEWTRLMNASDAGVFNSWEWLYPWHRRVAPKRMLHILTARDASGRLAGLLPLAIDFRRVAGVTLRRLAFLGEAEVGSDYLDVVSRRDERPWVTYALLQGVKDRADTWDLLDLTDIDESSPTLDLVRDLFPLDDYAIEAREGEVCPYEVFEPGLTFDAFIKTAKRRDNFNRRRKWLEKQPGYRVERTMQPRDVPSRLSEFMRLHELRWACEGGSGGITGPDVEAFHRDATELLAERGQLCLYTMWVGEPAVAIASVYGIIGRDKFIYYQSGRDPEWQSKSAGLVLVGETFRHALELGLREYDFLRGLEAYKADWVTRERRTAGLRIYRRGGRGGLLTLQEQANRAARRTAKRLLSRSPALQQRAKSLLARAGAPN